MPGNTVQAGPLWAWPDAVFSAVLAVCLATVFCLFAMRFRRPAAAAGPAVSAALVVALTGAVLLHERPVARVVVAAVAVVLAAAAVLVHRRLARPAAAGAGENEIAPPGRRC